MGVWVFPEPGLLSQCLCAMQAATGNFPILQPGQGWHCPLSCSPCCHPAASGDRQRVGLRGCLQITVLLKSAFPEQDL